MVSRTLRKGILRKPLAYAKHALPQLSLIEPPSRVLDQMFRRSRQFYLFLADARVGCHAAAFWLGAAAITLIFSFLGFFCSRLLLCWPLAISISLGLIVTLGTELGN